MIFFSFFIFIVWYFYSQPQKTVVNFFDVGQGDSSLIITPNKKTILIDGGPDNTVLRRLGDSLPFYRRQIDLIIFSHFHDDHITGLIEVLKRYRVKRIIYVINEFTPPILKILLDLAQQQKIIMTPITTNAELNLAPNCLIDFLNPGTLGVKDDQNNSLLVKFFCENKKYLFTGDNSAAVEKALLSSTWDLSADVLKISHHGSNTASIAAFLQKVNPQLAVISVGRDNNFGHPSPIVLERLNKLNIKFKRTDELGSFKITTP